jgi:SSS family solute:Na+ symporter
MYMAGSARILAYNFLMIPLIVCALYFFTWMIATSSIVLFPNGLADGDNCLGAILQHKAPVLGVFVLIGVFCAGMSTVDAQMLSAGSLVTRDIKEVIAGRESTVAEFIQGRICTISLLVIIYICGLIVKNYSIMWLIVFGINLTVVFVAPTFGVFYWKRASTAGAFMSMLLGFIVYFIFGFPPLARLIPFKLPATTCALGTSVIVFILVSLLTNSKKLANKREEYTKILR